MFHMTGNEKPEGRRFALDVSNEPVSHHLQYTDRGGRRQLVVSQLHMVNERHGHFARSYLALLGKTNDESRGVS